MERAFLDTGNTDAKRKDLLQSIATILQKHHGYRRIRPIMDSVGVYAYIMQDPNLTIFCLIAKGSKLWKGIISCQESLLKQTRKDRRVIILAWYPQSGSLRFFQFDPGEILSNQIGFNVRKNVRMINFLIGLGQEIDPLKGVVPHQPKKKQTILG